MSVNIYISSYEDTPYFLQKDHMLAQLRLINLKINTLAPIFQPF